MRYADIWPKYAKYWDAMVINPNRVASFEDEAKIAIANKATYEQISAGTPNQFPWALIATLHRRESDANFNTYLGNGQLLTERTTVVPINRGPFTKHLPDIPAFVKGGIDAIQEEDWHNVLDWRLEKQLYYAMLFNGEGYELMGLPSPYIFGGTNIQRPGKYVRDHVFNPSLMDPQPGCAPLLQMIAKLDPTVTFVRET